MFEHNIDQRTYRRSLDIHQRSGRLPYSINKYHDDDDVMTG